MVEQRTLVPAVMAALARVHDPEIHRPITDLGMVGALDIDDSGSVAVTILLTIPGCPLASTIENQVKAAVLAVDGVTGVRVTMSAMSDAQRTELRNRLRGGAADPGIPFAQPGSTTRLLLIASGKGGVGKSSITVNLALALARMGKAVGVLDADIYGHSVPRLLGLEGARPTVVDNMMMPVPALGLRVMSMGMLKQSPEQVIAWRGPILDRALQQMLVDVYWGDLDYLLFDLPPGTGDVALSLGNKLPNAEVLVVTTPQAAASDVAERAGTMANMMHQRVLGVIENMAYLDTVCPHCGKSHRVDVFGTGGGSSVAAQLTNRLGYGVPLLAQVPLDPELRIGGDAGDPLVLAHPDRPAAAALLRLAALLAGTARVQAGD